MFKLQCKCTISVGGIEYSSNNNSLGEVNYLKQILNIKISLEIERGNVSPRFFENPCECKFGRGQSPCSSCFTHHKIANRNCCLELEKHILDAIVLCQNRAVMGSVWCKGALQDGDIMQHLGHKTLKNFTCWEMLLQKKAVTRSRRYQEIEHLHQPVPRVCELPPYSTWELHPHSWKCLCGYINNLLILRWIIQRRKASLSRNQQGQESWKDCNTCNKRGHPWNLKLHSPWNTVLL